MPLFQNTVVKKYTKELNIQKVQEAYALYQAYFLNPAIQANIREAKEEQFQEGFLRKLFVEVLGYTLYPDTEYNLTTELKNTSNSKKVDGAVLIDNKAVAVIELKGTDTTDLSKIEVQAFGYKNNQQYCTYVITSNFEKLRFYIDNAIEFIEFNLFTLSREEFNLLWLCLSYKSIEQNIPKRIKEESLSQEDTITKKLYKDYSLFKRELYQNLVAQNPQFEPLALFKKSQKLLDRLLFLFFAEDRQLLPPNSVRLILNDWKDLQERDVEIPLYDRFKKYFEYLNTGYKGKRYDVFPYNGGLFKPDPILDAVTINDNLLYSHTLKLSEYDFVSEVDVNILGHIFENSLNELDEIKAQLEGQEIDKSKTKRKKDGVFYTPKYITKYIVENTVGKLCAEKKEALRINDEDYIIDKKRQKKATQELADRLNTYKNWLLQLTICDPACGSGAFLNQALDFLINEHKYIDELQAKLFGDAFILSDIEKSILENNLYGVDLNEESVEIAKLSLWLRTAQPNRKLNDLNNNIKCGNSLIDDPAVAGEKAFKWQEQFPKIFKVKEKKLFHVVFCLFNSRYAYKHIDKTDLTGLVGFTHPSLTLREEEILAECLSEVAKEKNLNIVECNICSDHVHAIIVCEKEELREKMGLWKGKSSYLYNRRVNPSVVIRQQDKEHKRNYADGTIEKFWAKSFDFKEIETEKQLEATRNYIRNNRIKHGLQGATGQQISDVNATYENRTDGPNDYNKETNDNKETDGLTRWLEDTVNDTAAPKENNETDGLTRRLEDTGATGGFTRWLDDSDAANDNKETDGLTHRLDDTVNDTAAQNEIKETDGLTRRLENTNKIDWLTCRSELSDTADKQTPSTYGLTRRLNDTVNDVAATNDYKETDGLTRQADDSCTTDGLTRRLENTDKTDGLTRRLATICCSLQQALRTEYKGGFNVVIGNPPYVQLQSMGAMSDILKDCGYQTYNKSADLYCLFYERGCQILKPKGYLGYITSNKWLRVNYGESLRTFLVENVNPQILIDFPGIPVFADAVVDPHILILTNESYKGKTEAFAVKKSTHDLKVAFETNKIIREFSSTSWVIMPHSDAVKLELMKNNGKELKDLPINIYRGILTGYNEAFYIDAATRQNLIASNARSNEVIKPMVRGRGISAYTHTDFEYLICTFPALKLDIENYPAVKAHLLSFGYDRLKQTGESGARKKASGKWFETQDSIGYYKEFTKPKIIYPNMTSVFPFMYDESGFYSNDKSFILTAKDNTISLLFLTSVLNSSLAKLWIWYNCPELGDDRREIRKIYFEHFPIPYANEQQTLILEEYAKNRIEFTSAFQDLCTKFTRTIQREFNLESLTTKLVNWHSMNYNDFIKELEKNKVKATLSQKAEWEDYFTQESRKALELKSKIEATDKEIDRMVYELYGLSEEDIAIVESNS